MSISRITQAEKPWPLYHKKDGTKLKLLWQNSTIQMFVVAEYWFLLIGSLKFCHWFVNTISSNTISKKIASEAHAAESFSRRCYQIKKYLIFYGSFSSITTFTMACHEPILCHLPPTYPLTHDLDENCALQILTQRVVVISYRRCGTTYQSQLQESRIQNGNVDVYLNITCLPITRLCLPTPTCSKKFLSL